MSFHPRLDDRLEAELMRLAKETGKDPGELLNQAVLAYLEDLEDIRDAEAVLERVRAGEEAVRSPEEVKRRLGLDL
ncbi:type II toxin-antitoxin system RelB family antitoxin [Thiohalorhabdus sp.]|uniref:type II toxin-antitoxin system RelB family antitoxin n=1 Tax=Thiohalorhabdus sp. TaxID=3094134 RepID=UPI002FC3CFD8